MDDFNLDDLCSTCLHNIVCCICCCKKCNNPFLNCTCCSKCNNKKEDCTCCTVSEGDSRVSERDCTHCKQNEENCKCLCYNCFKINCKCSSVYDRSILMQDNTKFRDRLKEASEKPELHEHFIKALTKLHNTYTQFFNQYPDNIRQQIRAIIGGYSSSAMLRRAIEEPEEHLDYISNIARKVRDNNIQVEDEIKALFVYVDNLPLPPPLSLPPPQPQSLPLPLPPPLSLPPPHPQSLPKTLDPKLLQPKTLPSYLIQLKTLPPYLLQLKTLPRSLPRSLTPTLDTKFLQPPPTLKSLPLTLLQSTFFSPDPYLLQPKTFKKYNMKLSTQINNIELVLNAISLVILYEFERGGRIKYFSTKLKKRKKTTLETKIEIPLYMCNIAVVCKNLYNDYMKYIKFITKEIHQNVVINGLKMCNCKYYKNQRKIPEIMTLVYNLIINTKGIFSITLELKHRENTNEILPRSDLSVFYEVEIADSSNAKRLMQKIKVVTDNICWLPSEISLLDAHICKYGTSIESSRLEGNSHLIEYLEQWLKEQKYIYNGDNSLKSQGIAPEFEKWYKTQYYYLHKWLKACLDQVSVTDQASLAFVENCFSEDTDMGMDIDTATPTATAMTIAT